MTNIVIVVVLLAIVLGGLVRMLKGLARLRRQIANAWAQVDAQLRERQDVARQFVDRAAEGGRVADSALGSVRQALLLVQQTPDGVKSRRQSEGALAAALAALVRAVDATGLASPPLLTLREALLALQNRIRIVAQFYNVQVLIYNAKRTIFPLSLMARLAGFPSADPFEVDGH